MMKKKNTRKKKSTKKWLILLTASVCFVAVGVFAYRADKQAALEQRDREKFAMLEKTMTGMQSDLGRVAGSGSWTIEKYCTGSGQKFDTSKKGSCVVALEQQEGAYIGLADLRAALDHYGQYGDVGYLELWKTSAIDYSIDLPDIGCLVNFSETEPGRVTSTKISCSSTSLDRYYPKQQLKN